ncbi:UNVERIFIED_CONTAM: hypothetical protein Slati_3640000 [Sesamum latifolium]|uniref:Tf2-1-like SH3-like domain-containing protein n=1 Tax=Sesamum latifolium TaxID=2727402 RepID=A0AAW2U0B4_9LAMI
MKTYVRAERRRAENGDYARGALCTVCYASWQYQDVSGLETLLLVANNEERCGRIVAKCLTCQQVKAEPSTSCPICWDIEGLRQLEGPELVQETVDKIQTVKQCLKAAQDRQKSYVNKHRREMEYEVGKKVFLRVSPWRGILRFGKKEKLSPRYIGPYEILERVGPLAYRLALLAELSQIHDVFHVSMLRRYRSDPSHILREPEIEISEGLTYVEEPTEILDRV